MRWLVSQKVFFLCYLANAQYQKCKFTKTKRWHGKNSVSQYAAMSHTNLVNMEYEVQLTNILKTFIKGLHKDLDQVEDAKFTLGRIHTEDEV